MHDPLTGEYGRLEVDGSVTPMPSLKGEPPLNPMTEQPSLGSRALTMAKQSVLPTAGTLLGGMAGTAAAPFTGGIANPVTGAMAGGAAGEYLNQKVGLTEPSMGAVALSGALSGLPGAVRTLGMGITPGVEAGVQNMAARVARGVPLQYLAKPGAVSALYQEAERLGAVIPKDTILKAAETVGQGESEIVKSYQLAAIKRGLNGVYELLAKPPGSAGFGPAGDLELTQLLPNMQRLGAIYGYVARKGGPAQEALGTLYHGMIDALDQAAKRGSGPGIEALTRAKEMFKRNLAGEELQEAVFRATKTVGGHENVSGDALLKVMQEGSPVLERLQKWLPKSELDDIRATFAKLAPLPQVGAGAKGGMDPNFIQRGLIGGVLGHALVPDQPFLGPAVGILGAQALTNVMMSPPLRAIVRQLADSRIGGHSMTIDQVLAAAMQFARQDPQAAGQMVGAGAGAAVNFGRDMLTRGAQP
jgi:hypothetical protein